MPSPVVEWMNSGEKRGVPGSASARAALTATRFDADTVNVLFPDSSAQYWSAQYTAVPGTRIRIDGVYPYARYTSWNVYDPILRPEGRDVSTAQLSPEDKNAISHRGHAFRALLPYLVDALDARP